jgi:hypothetical protein
LQNLVISRTELIRKRIRFVGEEVGKRGEVKTTHVFGNVVVVCPANFAAESERVPALQPAQGVIQNNRGVAPALRFASGSAKAQSSCDIEKR